MIRRFWQALSSALGSGMRQQVTRSGFAFTLTIVIVGFAAFVSANNLLFLILAALLATFLISGLVNRLGLAGLELDLVLPEHISARRKITARMRVRNSKLWMPSFSIHLAGSPETGLTRELYFPVLPSNRMVEAPVEIEFQHRGVYSDNTFAFSSRFPFGFTQRRAQVQLDREVLVYPSVEPQGGFGNLLGEIAGEIESMYRGRGHDFYRIRPYEYLESARHVDWKATAHTRSLQVREFAREEDQSVIVMLDLHASEDGMEAFERAIDCTAYLVWRLSNMETRLRFWTQRFDRTVPENADAYAILKYLALVLPVEGASATVPHDERSFHVLLTTRPDHFAFANMPGVRIVDARTLLRVGANAASGPEPARAH